MRFEVRHGCDWEYLPVMDTNPEQRTRVCKICGETQVSEGVTVVPGAASIPATPWRVAAAREGTTT